MGEIWGRKEDGYRGGKDGRVGRGKIWRLEMKEEKWRRRKRSGGGRSRGRGGRERRLDRKEESGERRRVRGETKEEWRGGE